MKRITLLTFATAAALGVAALVNVARATDTPAPAPRPALAASFAAARCADMDAHMAARFAYVEVKLKLTDVQKAEFKTLTQTMKSAAQPMQAMCADRFDPDRSQALPDRMDRMQKMAEARAESLRTTVPAMKAFYASLTLDQQKVADDLLGGMGGGMGGRHGHHGHRGWGGEGPGPMMGR